MKEPFYAFEMLSSIMRKPYVSFMLANLREYHKRTYHHSIRVAMESIQIGERLGLTEREIYELAEGALLYDIGKLKVPLRILDKPDSLNEEEFDIIKRHPLFSFDRIREVKEFHSPVVELIALMHHVYLDGTGYPARGDVPPEVDFDRVPYAARIVCIADIYDAMISARNYDRSYSGEYAIAVLREMANSRKVDKSAVLALSALMEEEELLFDNVERFSSGSVFDTTLSM